jgi:hypothetical protein
MSNNCLGHPSYPEIYAPTDESSYTNIQSFRYENSFDITPRDALSTYIRASKMMSGSYAANYQRGWMLSYFQKGDVVCADDIDPETCFLPLSSRNMLE